MGQSVNTNMIDMVDDFYDLDAAQQKPPPANLKDTLTPAAATSTRAGNETNTQAISINTVRAITTCDLVRNG